MYTEDVRLYFLERGQLMSSIATDSDFFLSVKKAIDSIQRCYLHRDKITTAGNGGSSAQSQHFVAELVGRMKQNRTPFSDISLASDTSVITCFGNDYGYERVFSRQLEAIASPEDLFIAFTTSGESRNIMEALQMCCASSIPSLVVSGTSDDNIKRICDSIIEIPSEDTPLVQEIQMMVTHMICESVEQSISNYRKEECIWDNIVKLK